jgi:hypothetical protein
LVAFIIVLAGCSAGSGVGREEKAVDPNAYPANYKTDVIAYLQLNQSQMENIRDAYISTPALNELGGSQNRYFVCLRVLDGKGLPRDIMVIFFSGQINQYVDATGKQCGAAAYQPFTELVALVNVMGGRK